MSQTITLRSLQTEIERLQRDIEDLRSQVRALAQDKIPDENGSDTSLDNVRQLAARFVEQVRELPQVREILLDAQPAIPRIWIVFDAEPFQRDPRERVYQAELAAHDAHPDTRVRFRLINLVEYENTPPEKVLPQGAEILWQRATATR